MRIVIVEDEEILLEKLKLILDTEKGFKVVGAYSSAEEALSNIKKSFPDMMIIDLKLPGMSGNELMRKIKNINPTINLLAFTGFEDRETVLSAFREGADGFILKGSSLRELVEAISNIQNGGIPMSPRIARTIINEFCNHSVNNHFILTNREKDVLRYIEKDLSYKEIAERIDISRHTVHTHIKNIYKKLKASCRKDAIQKARRNGLL